MFVVNCCPETFVNGKTIAIECLQGVNPIPSGSAPDVGARLCGRTPKA